VAQVNGIVVWAEGIKAELAKRLPRQRKTQRNKLAVLVATMLHVRSANLVELAAARVRPLGYGLSMDFPVSGQRFGVLRHGYGTVRPRDPRVKHGAGLYGAFDVKRWRCRFLVAPAVVRAEADR
jgi:hypothetical protein